MTAWTQTIRISWRRPLVSYVSEKAAILRALDEAGLVWRYVATEEQTGVKVKDALHQVVFGPDFIEFTALRSDGHMDSLLAAVNLVWKRLKPTEVRRIDPDFRFLTTVNLGYDEARMTAGDRANPMPEGVVNVDFAVVGDLATDDPKSQIKVECGIVERPEAAQRLAVGQPALRSKVGIPPSLFPLKSIPEVAIFDRQAWRISDLELTTIDEATDLWSRARGKAEEIDVALFEHLIGDGK